MVKFRAVAVAAAAFAFSAFVWGGDVAAIFDYGKPSPGARLVDVRVTDRGNSRTVWIGTSTTPAGGAINQTYTFTAPSEIDVTAASLYVRTGSTAEFSGGALAYTNASGESTNYPIQFAFNGTESQHFTFNPPIRLRSGDHFAFESDAAPSNTTAIEVTLNGYPPSATRENGMMAR